MNTSSYSPIASGTYNRWKVEFIKKTTTKKNKKKKKKKQINKHPPPFQNINTTQAMAEPYITRLGGSHFYTF